ncbi:MAG: hypothetical protein L3K19_06745 [Thermoplasmata archaeon]|nr:hypothetical protein [Thermoplasmata archaeon]
MKLDPWRSAVVVPVFAYAVASACLAFSGLSVGLLIAFFLTALSLPASAFLGRRFLPFAPGAVLAGATGLFWFFNGSAPTGVLADVGAGVLLASPLAFLAAVWVTEDLPGTSVAMVIIGLTDSVGLLAASRLLGSGSIGNGSSALLAAISSVYSDQGYAISQLLRGQVPAEIPMGQSPDAVFVLLGILAMVGLLLCLLRGPGVEWLRSAPRPAAPRHPMGSLIPRPPPSPELAGILASATRPELPAFPAYSGLLPVLASAGAAAGFLAAAEFEPGVALLAVAVGVALVTGYLVWTGTPTRRLRRAVRPPDGPSPGPDRR